MDRIEMRVNALLRMRSASHVRRQRAARKNSASVCQPTNVEVLKDEDDSNRPTTSKALQEVDEHAPSVSCLTATDWKKSRLIKDMVVVDIEPMMDSTSPPVAVTAVKRVTDKGKSIRQTGPNPCMVRSRLEEPEIEVLVKSMAPSCSGVNGSRVTTSRRSEPHPRNIYHTRRYL